MVKNKNPVELSIQSPSNADLAATPQALQDAGQQLLEETTPQQTPDDLAVPLEGTFSTQAANVKAAQPVAAGTVSPGDSPHEAWPGSADQGPGGTVQTLPVPQGAGTNTYGAHNRLNGPTPAGQVPNTGPQLEDGVGTTNPGHGIESVSAARGKEPVDEVAREAARIAKAQLLEVFRGFSDFELGRILVALKRHNLDWLSMLIEASPSLE